MVEEVLDREVEDFPPMTEGRLLLMRGCRRAHSTTAVQSKAQPYLVTWRDCGDAHEKAIVDGREDEEVTIPYVHRTPAPRTRLEPKWLRFEVRPVTEAVR